MCAILLHINEYSQRVTNLKILLVTGVYHPSSGGSEISIRTLMEGLHKLGHEVHTLTHRVDYFKQKEQEVLNGVNIIRINETDLKSKFFQLAEELEIDVVLTQLMWSERVLKYANLSSLKSIYFVRSVGIGLDLSIDSKIAPTAIVANSMTTKNFVKNYWKRDSYVLYPIIRFDDYYCEKREQNYITIINPIDVKGGDIFKQVAQIMPERNFLAVRGWQHWKNPNNGAWDIKRMESNSKAFGGKLIIPSETDFSDNVNVSVEGPFEDMRIVYAKTKLLLVPSLWEEPFGRAVVEAMLNYIPVIASKKGSLPYVVGRGGSIINKVRSVKDWKKSIKNFDNDEYYLKKSRLAATSSNRFHPDKLIKDFSEFLESL